MPRVKICGVTNAEDRDVAVAAGADALGYIVDVPVDTAREIDSETAAALVEGVPPLVSSVLVTMPSSVAEVVRLHDCVGSTAVQVHSGLSVAELDELGDRIDAHVIAVVDAAAESVEGHAAAADALLVDTAGEAGRGGTGRPHDWSRTEALIEPLDVPVLLAGGLTPENVDAAVRTVDPFAVDTASGVERRGGVKDHDAVERFVRNASRTEAVS